MNEDFKTWTVRSRFRFGDVVYLKVREEPVKGMVTAVCIRTSVSYFVTWSNCTETCHADCELSAEFIPDYQRAEAGEANK